METASVSQTTRRVVVQQEIPDAAITGLAKFFERYYVRPKMGLIQKSSYSRTETEGGLKLSWTIRPVENQIPRPLQVVLSASQAAIVIDFQGIDQTDKSLDDAVERTTDEVESVVLSYFENLRTSSLYFVIGATEEHSEAPVERGMMYDTLKRIFTGNATNLFLLFTLASFALFYVIGTYAIFIVIGLQLITVVFSDRIVFQLGNVRPSAATPLVTIASVRSNHETLQSITRHGSNILPQIREEIMKHATVAYSQSTIEQLKSTIIAALMRHGIIVTGKDVTIRTRNTYELVDRVSKRFNRPAPKITIQNSLVANAAATGISSHHSTISITAGSLEELSDQELEAVVGHELGHVKGHDPVILFGVTSFEFLGRFFLWTPLLYYLGLFYFLLAFGGIYLVGKFLETRADTESAVVLGNPSALASALTKIGFRQLYREKYDPGVRLFDWFRMDPHPPIYFRVSRLSRLSEERKPVRHMLLISIRDVIVGFFSSVF